MKKLKWIGGKLGYSVSRGTSSKDIQNLIDSLRVVSIAHPLIRVGSESDGGYLIPSDLDGITACYSPGVDINASFEADLYRNYLIGSHLADRTVDAPPVASRFLSFTRKHIGEIDDGNFMTMDTWVVQTEGWKNKGDLILQMDIEGAEYTSILRMSETLLLRFRIIVIEIHDVEDWRNSRFFSVVSAFFRYILQHFWVVHNHPNNCCGLTDLGGIPAPRVFELTLLRKDRCQPTGHVSTFPHPLDRANIPGRKDLKLPYPWFC